jgi:dTDP-4-amino-4,6-dideoxygalactose transaminase
MQFIDLKTQQKRIRKGIDASITRVLEHGKYIMGPEIPQLEQTLANFAGVKHAIGCASGTDALLMALMAKNVGPGDAVFTSPFTFIATAEVIRLLGATPVFVDIDPKTFNMDPDLLENAIQAVTKSDRRIYPLPHNSGQKRLVSKCIIAVDLFGLPADYDAINAIAEKHEVFVIEDAAQSFGADYKGRKACALAEIGCTSFFPAKPLGCYGDGGMCFTDSDELNDIMRSIRIHGQGTDKYDNVRVGINGRLDTLQAAILLNKFEIFPEEIQLRQKVASRYNEQLSSNVALVTPEIPNGYLSAWAQYSILAKDPSHRSELQNRLKENGIPTAVYYPKPLHAQTAFQSLGYQPGDFPVSQDFSTRIFSLPMHPYLEEADQNKISETINRV